MTMKYKIPRKRRQRRRAMILPVVLVGLLVVAMIGAAIAHTAMLHHRSARQAEQELQASWLADSALQRAETRLAQDAAYVGETWNIAAEEMRTGYAGVATIRVTDVDGGRLILIEAIYPEHSVRRTLQQREKHLQPTLPGDST